MMDDWDDEDAPPRYFAMNVWPDEPAHDPGGIMRRRYHRSRPWDEAFGRDQRWHRTTAKLAEDFKGNMDTVFTEIDEEDAARIIARWRVKWAPEDAAREARIAARDEADDLIEYWIVTRPRSNEVVGMVRDRSVSSEGVFFRQELTPDLTWEPTEALTEWLGHQRDDITMTALPRPEAEALIQRWRTAPATEAFIDLTAPWAAPEIPDPDR